MSKAEIKINLEGSRAFWILFVGLLLRMTAVLLAIIFLIWWKN